MDVYPPLEIGTDFLGYRIEEQIGRGGMGVVYRAYDLRLKRPVALKLVAPSLARDPRFRARFARESELAMSLEHPNVVPIYDAGDVDGRVYLAMRLVDGTDLGSMLRDEGALAPARTVAICTQVAAALDAAHAKGLVHRDVKPSNVLLDGTEHAYLADFGLTRRFDETGSDAVDGRSIGTPAYVAPEQLEGKPVDGRADVYSLGCLLHECLTGERVFPRASRLAVAWAHLEEEPPRASRSRRELPEAIDRVVARAMAKEPEDRYPTCAELVAAAEDALGLRTRPSVRRRALFAGAALVVIVLAIAATAGVVLVGRGGGAPAPPPATQDNTLVRIDPATNRVAQVVAVDTQPMAVAAAGSRVWVYSRLTDSVSEVDSDTNRLRDSTVVRATPATTDARTGPVLVADAGGAWLVGRDDRRSRYVLARIPSGGGERDEVLDGRPAAVELDYGSVWVVVEHAHGSELRRIAPATGDVTGTRRFPGLRLDSLAAGLGHVWAMSSSTATLYRVDPRSLAVTGHVDLGTRAGRPWVSLGDVWVAISDSGGDTLVVNPRSLTYRGLGCCALTHDSYDTGGFGATWSIAAGNGAVVRWNGQSYQVDKQIQVTDAPFYDGSCLTSIVSGAGAVWVTLAQSIDYTCNLR